MISVLRFIYRVIDVLTAAIRASGVDEVMVSKIDQLARQNKQKQVYPFEGIVSD